uniref:Uncharacterized protein n=1 Tax=Octactis speculum TaxID=3111310 RepID=A0A7S2HP08_9STRA|mmetsp:Transcript_7982/g.9991  ORF Transcript_7982/g.9991 Transcript_7982/m.9991 type:complete len:131 (+) Transcript_7982:159-551(+)
MLNLPPQLVPQMHQSLLSDIAWAQENAENGAEEADVNFESLIVVAPCSVVNSKKEDQEDSKPLDSALKLPANTLFDRFDDEYLCEGARFSFTFETAPSTPGAPPKLFLVSVIDFKQYEKNVGRLGGVFGS